MVAEDTKNPDEPPRRLTAEIERELGESLRAVARDGAPALARLSSALQAAAKDARTRSLQPEELLIAFKTIEGTAGSTLRESDSRDGVVGRSQLIRALIAAYYAGE